MSNEADALESPPGQPARPPASSPGDAARSQRRWLILFVGLIAMTAGCTFQYGLPKLIPETRCED
jgi:hypothetical protein